MTTHPGHRTAQHLIEAEAYRRIMAGQAPVTLAEFAHHLSDWFREAYPDAAPPSADAVEDLISETWHRRHEMIRGG